MKKGLKVAYRPSRKSESVWRFVAGGRKLFEGWRDVDGRHLQPVVAVVVVVHAGLWIEKRFSQSETQIRDFNLFIERKLLVSDFGWSLFRFVR